MDNSSSPIIQPKPANKNNKKKWLLTLLILVLIAGGASAYWWRDNQAKADQTAKQTEISKLENDKAELESKIKELKKQLADEKSKNTEESATTPSAETLQNIQDAITSGNTAALEGYMASTVRVIFAASEGVGDRTPMQTVSDLAYLKSATDPWDFDLAPATLSNYASGDYAQYFPEGALVGKSANGYVISFAFDDTGKISGIFVSSDANLL